jgi:hypothetical protein
MIVMDAASFLALVNDVPGSAVQRAIDECDVSH